MAGPRERAPARHLAWSVALAAVLGLIVTGLAFASVRSMSQDRLAYRFRHAAASFELAVRQRLQNDVEALQSLRDGFTLHGSLSRREFGVLAQALLRRHPGIQAFEWVPAVRQRERAAFEAAARRQGLRGFRLTDRDAHGRLVDAGPSDVYYPIFYVEPLAGNEAALGYAPILPPRDEAIAIARDTGEPAASEGFAIVQSPTGAVGVALFVPIYAGATPPATVAERRARLNSLVEGLILPAEMLAPLIQQARALGIEIGLVDTSAPVGSPALIPAASLPGAGEPPLRHEAPIDMGQRRWVLSFTLAHDHALGGVRGMEWLVLLAGLVMTGLLASHLQTLFDRRARAEELAETRAQALAQAQALDQMKNNFVNALAHDLRGPLTSVVGYAELLEDEVGGVLTPAQKAYAAQIQWGAKRLERLMDDMLDYARIDAGAFQLKCGPADLVQAMREVAESLGPQLRAAGLALTLEAEPDAIMAQVDAPRVERVLFNLLHNAIKFTPPGGTIHMRARAEGDHARLEVADTGVGIAQEHFPQLFQRFRQLPGGAEKGGTGLGLSIARAIVEAHGGTIQVESTLGQGATFWFTLPLGACDGADEAPAS